MSNELYVMEDSRDLLRWNLETAEQPELSREDASLLYTEIWGHGAELLYDSYGTLYWKQGDKDVIRITLGDVIDQVCDWNYSDINRCLDDRMNAISQENYWEIDTRYKQLKDREEHLNQLFDKTSIGQQIRNRMKELAAKTFDQVRMIPVIKNPVAAEESARKQASFQRQPRRGMVM